MGNPASSVWRSVVEARPGGGSGVLVEGRGVREKEFECLQGGLSLGNRMRSRVMVDGDLRVEIGRILSPLYVAFLVLTLYFG